MTGQLVVNGLENDHLIKKFDIVKKDNFVFYSLNKGIYKLDLETTITTKIYDGHIRCLNIVDNELYFITLDKNIRLMKTNLNGNILEELYYNMPGDYHEVRYSSPYLYIHDRFGCECVSRVNVKTNSIEALPFGNPLSLFIDNSCSYYSNQETGFLEKMYIQSTGGVELNNCELNIIDKKHNIMHYKYNPKSAKKINLEILYKGELSSDCYNLGKGNGAYEINVSGEWIFFLKPNKYWFDNEREFKFNLYKIRNDGSDLTKLCEDTVINISIYGSWIYFINKNDNDSVYRISIDGTQKQLIDPKPSCDIHIIGEEIFYFNKYIPKELYDIQNYIRNIFIKLEQIRDYEESSCDKDIPENVHEILYSKTDEISNILDEKAKFVLKILKIKDI